MPVLIAIIVDCNNKQMQIYICNEYICNEFIFMFAIIFSFVFDFWNRICNYKCIRKSPPLPSIRRPPPPPPPPIHFYFGFGFPTLHPLPILFCSYLFSYSSFSIATISFVTIIVVFILFLFLFNNSSNSCCSYLLLFLHLLNLVAIVSVW